MNKIKSMYKKIKEDAKTYASSKNVPLPTIWLPLQYILISTSFVYAFTVSGLLSYVVSFDPIPFILLKTLEIYTYIGIPIITFALFFGTGKYFYRAAILQVYLFNKLFMYIINRLNLRSWKKNKTDHPVLNWMLKIQSYASKNKTRSRIILVLIVVALSVTVHYDTYAYMIDSITQYIYDNIHKTIDADIQFVPHVYALSRDDIANIKSEIKTTQQNLDGMDKRISEQYVTISNNESTLKQKQDELREIKRKSNESWNAAQSIDAAQKAVTNAELEIKKSKDILRELLIEKSDYIKKIKALEIKLKDTELELKVISKPDTSNLVKRIAIQNSKICETLIINHINTTCPTYRQLRTLDSSNTDVSGKFVVDEKSKFYHRSAPQVINSLRWYDSDQQIRLFVNAPAEYLTRMPTITIYPNFNTYMINGDMTQVIPIQYSNHTITKTIRNGTEYTVDYTKAYQTPQQTTGETGRILYHHVYVDPFCKQAKINADKWKELLPIIIDYMRNGCDDKRLLIDFKEIIPADYTVQDIATSQKYKDEQRLKEIKKFCIYKYKSCTEADNTKMLMQNEK